MRNLEVQSGLRLSVLRRSPSPAYGRAALLVLFFLLMCPALVLAAPGDVKWKVELKQSRSAPAISSNGLVYVTMTKDPYAISALNATNGVGVWNCSLHSETEASVSIGANGLAYAGVAMSSLFQAVNATNGLNVWNCSLGGIDTTATVGPDGLVFVGSFDTGKLHAVNATNGDSVWNCSLGGGVHSSAALGADGLLYVGSNNDMLHAVNATNGDSVWNCSLGGDVQSSPAIGNNGLVYVGSKSNMLHAVNATNGDSVWNCSIGADPAYASPVIDTNGLVYIGSGLGQKLLAVNATSGASVWNCTLGNVFSTPAIGSDGLLYLTSHAKMLHAVNATNGASVWNCTLDEISNSPPAIGGDGTVYVITYTSFNRPNSLYAIESTSRGLAATPWPKYQLNNFNRGYNFPPTASAGADDNVYEGATVKLNGLNSNDPDGTIVAYSWTQPSGSAVTLSDASSSQPSFTAPNVGSGGESLIFSLKVSDNNLAPANDTVRINVGDNTGPTAKAGPDQTVKEGSIVTLDGSNSTDPDSNIASYAWSQTAGTSVSLADSSAKVTTFTAPSVGGSGEALTFKLTVTDLLGLAGSDTVIINVTDTDTPPTANAGGNQNVTEGKTVVLSGSNSTAALGSISAYSWTQTSGETMTLSATDKVNATFVAPPVSNDTALVFKLTVTDSQGLKASDSAVITVKDSGITGVPEGFTPIKTVGSGTGNQSLGVECSAGASMTALEAVDPDTVANKTGMPSSLPYGLLDFTLKVSTAGDSANVTVALPNPAPAGASWYKYSAATGWIDYTGNATFSANRSQVVIQLTDGGAGDSDGTANGFIVDPSGLATSGSSDSNSNGCLMNPATSLGLEWLLLLLAPLAALRRRP